MNYCINFSLSEIGFFGFKIKEIFRKKSFKTLLITVLFLLTTNTFSQTGRVIQGKVFDSEGIALPGTNVVEGNSDNGVSTDFDGNFTITLENDDSSLWKDEDTGEMNSSKHKYLNHIMGRIPWQNV